MPVYSTQILLTGGWTLAFLVKQTPCSHYDLLIELAQNTGDLPDRMICLAGSGRNFHGQRRRPWEALEGNIHLSVHFAPNRKIERFGAAFSLLAAVSLIEVMDSWPGLDGQAGIKWVNDVLIHGAKVAGFLVHTLSLGEELTHVILGIGLNVERAPDIPPSPYVPKAGCLADSGSLPSPNAARFVLLKLLSRLAANYDLLCEGDSSGLIKTYRDRSLVLGRNVRVMTDPEQGEPEEIASGIVEEIGSHLELHLADRDRPITRGRLILIG